VLRPGPGLANTRQVEAVTLDDELPIGSRINSPASSMTGDARGVIGKEACWPSPHRRPDEVVEPFCHRRVRKTAHQRAATSRCAATPREPGSGLVSLALLDGSAGDGGRREGHCRLPSLGAGDAGFPSQNDGAHLLPPDGAWNCPENARGKGLIEGPEPSSPRSPGRSRSQDGASEEPRAPGDGRRAGWVIRSEWWRPSLLVTSQQAGDLACGQPRLKRHLPDHRFQLRSGRGPRRIRSTIASAGPTDPRICPPGRFTRRGPGQPASSSLSTNAAET
jgi:hypothetical protein